MIIYRYNQFAIKRTSDNKYIVVNLNGNYSNHAHIHNAHIGKVLCKLASKRQLPRSNDEYFINALIRISNNRKYIRELKDLLTKTNKK